MPVSAWEILWLFNLLHLAQSGLGPDWQQRATGCPHGEATPPSDPTEGSLFKAKSPSPSSQSDEYVHQGPYQ